MSVASNVQEVLGRIAAAARRAGREPSDVTLIAASKTVPVERIVAARVAGVRVFGENRVQEAAPKVAALDGVAWHMIGRLQRNKARRAVELFELIHSVDSVRLGETLDRLGRERARAVDVLLEVNVGGEESKAGLDPDDVDQVAETLAGRPGLNVHGLMTIPPPVRRPELARPYFVRLRELARRLEDRGLPGIRMGQLSMGMTSDFEIAVEEGATLVRVGTAIFGERPSAPRPPAAD